jgi:hypothetical protein
LSHSYVPQHEMPGPDEHFEQALGGDPPCAVEDELGTFVRDVRDAFPVLPILAEEAQLEAIIQAAGRISPLTPPARRKELRVRIPKIRSRAALVVAGFVVAMSSFGGLAMAGVLPNGVQNQVANVGATLGVSLPDGGDDESPDVQEATETEAPEPSETEAPETEKDDTVLPKDTEADDQGEDQQSDDQGEDQQSQADDQAQNEQSGDQGDTQVSQADDQGETQQSGDQSGSQDGSEGGDSSDSGSGDGGSD